MVHFCMVRRLCIFVSHVHVL